MNRNRVHRCLAAVAVVTTVGCVGQSTLPTGDPVAAAVQGRVTKEDGTPIGGPLVTVTLLSARVNGVAQFLGQLQIIADDNGRFLALFRGYDQPQTGSVGILVTPPIGSGLLAADTADIPVTIELNDPPRDTAFVEMILPPRP
jgi:hypothetical protein